MLEKRGRKSYQIFVKNFPTSGIDDKKDGTDGRKETGRNPDFPPSPNLWTSLNSKQAELIKIQSIYL